MPSEIIMNEPTLTFTDITIQEANAILAGLQELPAKVCNPLTQKLQQQAQQQLQPPAEAPAAAAE
jgi:hypothetical protein